MADAREAATKAADVQFGPQIAAVITAVSSLVAGRQPSELAAPDVAALVRLKKRLTELLSQHRSFGEASLTLRLYHEDKGAALGEA
jgi:hypothetical protein